MKNPYVILGVAPTASSEEIKTAYRRISRRLHPDVNSSPAAAAQFAEVEAAYELLNDMMGRSKYDQDANAPAKQEELDFVLQVTSSKREVMLLPEPQVVYLLADIYPDPRVSVAGNREVHLNLTLVLDRSNSMNGPRMEKVKVAAHQIIDTMTDQDYISIITFNDRAEIIIPATQVKDRPALKARASMIAPIGGTEIFQGLNAGVQQNRVYATPRMVNHIILLTDGHTFGDQEQCLELAAQAAREGIGISAMGLGNDWNDEFLDELASRTGGNTVYVNSPNAVVRFMNDHVRNLAKVFADRMVLSIAPEPDVVIESAFKLSPHPQPIEVNNGILPLGALQLNRPISVLLQFQLPREMKEGFRYVARLVASGDILANKDQAYQAVADYSTEVVTTPSHTDPPTAILDALSKLTLYRLQERAQEALEQGNVAEATTRLQNLATRLFSMGQTELATQALTEAKRVAHTSGLSDKGRKALKYQTRYLLMDEAESE